MKLQFRMFLIIILVEARKKKSPFKLTKPSNNQGLKEANEHPNGYDEQETNVPFPKAPTASEPFNEQSIDQNKEMSFSLNLKDFAVHLKVPANFLDIFFGGYRGPPPHYGDYGGPNEGDYGGPNQGGYGGPDQGSYGRPEQGGSSMLCWDWTLSLAVPIGFIMTYNNNTYSCTDNDWKQNDPGNSIDDDGCWSPVVQKVLPFGTSGYYCCDKVECKSDQTWQMTGQMLPNCYPGNILCWNWMTKEAVPVGSTMYFECNQYLCMDEDDWVQNGERDPSCDEINGCFSIITQEIVPYGVQGYWKCESVECIQNNKWLHTGGRLPGCGTSPDNGNIREHDGNPVVHLQTNSKGPHWPFKPNELSVQVNAKGKTFCWDWTKTEAVAVGSIMYYEQETYECTKNDWKKIGNNSKGAQI